MACRLNNYLRTYRKRMGLTQNELAFLLGAQSGTKIARYEKDNRTPMPETVFALLIIFRRTPRELFPGSYDDIEKTIIERARLLHGQLGDQPATPIRERKLQVLEALIDEAQAHNSTQMYEREQKH